MRPVSRTWECRERSDSGNTVAVASWAAHVAKSDVNRSVRIAGLHRKVQVSDGATGDHQPVMPCGQCRSDRRPSPIRLARRKPRVERLNDRERVRYRFAVAFGLSVAARMSSLRWLIPMAQLRSGRA